MDPERAPECGECERLGRLIRARFGGRVREVRVVARDGGLVLQGKAVSFHVKQLVQEAVRAATPVRVVANELRVDRPGLPPNPKETDMPTLRELMQKTLADGKVDGDEIERLSELLYADGRIDRAEAEFLVELHRRVERVGPAFERFVYAALKRHVLIDGWIGPDEAAWLRRVVFADGKVSDREKKLVRELRGEAALTCPEFDALYADCLP